MAPFNLRRKSSLNRGSMLSSKRPTFFCCTCAYRIDSSTRLFRLELRFCLVMKRIAISIISRRSRSSCMNLSTTLQKTPTMTFVASRKKNVINTYIQNSQVVDGLVGGDPPAKVITVHHVANVYCSHTLPPPSYGVSTRTSLKSSDPTLSMQAMKWMVRPNQKATLKNERAARAKRFVKTSASDIFLAIPAALVILIKRSILRKVT
mmetsp:Transcript_113237/g.283559  ORF Transcript_113237/g.283559 Transcript_113237/m.283559 type:complete len:206 (-) Transcript_113237:603-1220(-)